MYPARLADERWRPRAPDGDCFRQAPRAMVRLARGANLLREVECNVQAGRMADGATEPSPNPGAPRVSRQKAALLRLLLHAACDLSPREIALLAADVARGAAPDRAYWAGLVAGGEAARRAAALEALRQAVAGRAEREIVAIAELLRAGGVPHTAKPERSRPAE